MTTIRVNTEKVEAAIKGDTGALSDLVDLWLPHVLRWCIRLGGPGINHEDAAHDVFVVVINKISTLSSPEAFPAWIFGITRRVLARHRRQSWLNSWISFIIPENEDKRDSPVARVELSESTKKVMEIMGKLPSKYREVLVLCDLEERNDSEAASLLGLPVGTLKSRLRVARRLFINLARKYFRLEEASLTSAEANSHGLLD